MPEDIEKIFLFEAYWYQMIRTHFWMNGCSTKENVCQEEKKKKICGKEVE